MRVAEIIVKGLNPAVSDDVEDKKEKKILVKNLVSGKKGDQDA